MRPEHPPSEHLLAAILFQWGFHLLEKPVSSSNFPQPVRRLDATATLEELNARTDARLELLGMASGGAVGAARVRWPDGREGILTMSGAPASEIETTKLALNLARHHGIPCPRYEMIVELSEVTAIVQERLPGNPPAHIDDHLVEHMIGRADQFAGVLADCHAVPPLDLYLDRSGPGFCLHETLATYSSRTQQLLQAIRELAPSTPPIMFGDDLVHTDFHPGNVLVDEAGAITGIVDWDGLSRGNRSFCLVTLAFDLGWGRRFSPAYRDLTDAGLHLIMEKLDAIDEDLLRLFWAHMSLRLVDWSIRHHTEADVDHYLSVASSRLEL